MEYQWTIEINTLIHDDYRNDSQEPSNDGLKVRTLVGVDFSRKFRYYREKRRCLGRFKGK